MAAAFAVPLLELLFLCMVCTKGCYYTSRAVHLFLRWRILYSEYSFGSFFFFFFTDGWGRVCFQIYLLCAKDGQDKFVLHSDLKMITLGFLL